MFFWVVQWLVGEGGGVKNLIKYFSGLNIHEQVLVLGSIEKGFFQCCEILYEYSLNSCK